MNILDLVVGKPIRTSDERAEQIGPVQAIPIFGLDALSSAAYGPEAALSLLIPLGLLGVRYLIPISAAIITLLVIVYFSYRQTIAAYPNGGGSYTVARFNLGARASLLAAAALLADYILTAAVGISAGVGALVSAVPSLLPHTVSLCVGILIIITILNLRGVRDAGHAFALPTYAFVGTLLITVVGGVLRVLLSGGHPTPASPLPPPPPITEAVSYWLLLKAFASGCTALTGVEAVSNGVKAFREPTVKNAQRTLTVIIFLLAVLLAGISYLVRVYGITATDPGQSGYQSLLSMLVGAVFGKGVFYYLTIGSILIVLSLSANTAFADFPRLCRAISQNNYLPHVFGYRGRRLVYTYGIVVLAVLWKSSHPFPRRHGPAHPAFCRGRFSGLHALAGRHGDALAETSRSAMVEERTRQWARGGRHRHNRHRRPGGEIRGRRLDYAAFHSVDGCFLHRCPPPLPLRKAPHHLQRTRPGGKSQPASHCRHSHRPLEQNHLPGD